MKAQHTPGPWAFALHAHGPFEVFQRDGVTPLNEDIIATIDPDGSPDDKAEANARLIAAAPEMLKVLGMVERAFNVEQIDAMTAFVTMEKVRGIIAKALGKDGE